MLYTLRSEAGASPSPLTISLALNLAVAFRFACVTKTSRNLVGISGDGPQTNITDCASESLTGFAIAHPTALSDFHDLGEVYR